MAKAREELAQINMKLLRAALDEGLGRDYEYQDYVRWVGETESHFFAVFTEAALEARARGGESPSDEEAARSCSKPSRRGTGWPGCSRTTSKTRWRRCSHNGPGH